jgi:hypothetical protein
MPNIFRPRLDILPAPQRNLWPELAQTPRDFTLYGGTAIALRLGHRQSVDFDFFGPQQFEPQALLRRVPYLQDAGVLQSSANNLTASIDRGGPVQLTFFGNFDLGQVSEAELAEGPQFHVASLIDLAGMKAAVVTQRAETKDYLDIHALMTKAGISLSTMLAAAAIIYGSEFNPLIALKAIAYHGDPGLKDLPRSVRADLVAAVQAVDLQALPVLTAVRMRRSSP